MIQRLAVLVLACVLSACGSMRNRNSPAEFPAEAVRAPDKGVVILSTGAPSHCVSMATQLLVYDRSTKKRVDGGPLIFVDAYVHKSEFASHHGAVNAVLLAPGNYFFAPSIANPYFTGIKVPGFEFRVNPGETVYVGELFMTRSCSTQTTFEVRDHFERDMALARHSNPAIAERAPVKRLLQPIDP